MFKVIVKHGNLFNNYYRSTLNITKVNKVIAFNKKQNCTNDKISPKEEKFKMIFKEKENSKQIGDTFIYIMTDRHNIKPDKQIKYTKIKIENKITYNKEIQNYEKINYLKYSNLRNFFKKKLIAIFFPRDYPNSVREGYYHFSKHAFISGVAFYMMNFLTTQMIINSLGMSVSHPASIGFSAGISWVIKDGIGQVCTFIFSAKYTDAIQIDIKKWRNISLYMYSLSLLLEGLTLWKPQYFILIASMSTFLKLSAFIASVSTRIGILNYFCLEKNITDLTTKFLTQNNLGLTIGSLMGLMVSLSINFTFYNIFPIIFILSFIQAYSGVYANQKIYLLDMNPQRAFYVANEYITSNSILDPVTVNKKEKFLFQQLKFLHFCNYPLENIFKKEKNMNFLDSIISIFKENKFLVYIKKKYSYIKRKYTFKIYTFLRLDAENIDIFLSFLFSIKVHLFLTNQNMNCSDNIILETLKENLNWVDSINKKELVHKLVEQGWDTKFNLLEGHYRRYHVIH